MKSHLTMPHRVGILRSLFAAGCAALMLFSTVPAFAQKGRAPLAPVNQNGSRSGGGKKAVPADTTNVRVISKVLDLSEAARSAKATPKSGVVTNAFPAAEGFDDITTLVPGGWFFQNNSSPVGTIGYFQGNDTVFPSHAGATNAYIGVNFNSTTGANTISNWMLTPSGTFNNGDVISFYTRTVDTPSFADRLQVRLSLNGASTNVGTLPDDVGDFTTLGLDINSGLTTSGYPNTWTQFVIVLAVPPGGFTGRIGFRYYVPDGGPNGSNSDYIGIDTFSYTPAAVSGPVNVDSQVSFTTTTVGLTGNGVAACGTLGYTNQYSLNVDLRNIGTNTFTNPFFQVIELQQTDGVVPNPFRLRTADDFNGATCSGGLVGTTQAIPGPITPNQVVPVNFQIAMPQLRRFRFLVSVFATTTGSVTRNGQTFKLGNLAVEATGFDKAGNPILSSTFIPEKGAPTFALNRVSVTRVK